MAGKKPKPKIPFIKKPNKNGTPGESGRRAKVVPTKPPPLLPPPPQFPP